MLSKIIEKLNNSRDQGRFDIHWDFEVNLSKSIVLPESSPTPSPQFSIRDQKIMFYAKDVRYTWKCSAKLFLKEWLTAMIVFIALALLLFYQLRSMVMNRRAAKLAAELYADVISDL